MNSTIILLGFLTVVTNASNTSRPFPDDFLFGAATSAYQVEGGWNADGKGENIWDYLLHTRPDILNGTNGDISDDTYHNYKRDVQIMRELGLNAYRFSMAWTRILPNGRANNISKAGIAFYNNYINEMLKYNITPIVTLLHWDTPQKLQDLGGIFNSDFITWFQDYARIAFTNFGDRVKHWITVNEPKSICDESFDYYFTKSAPGINYYICAKTVSILHATTYRMYVKDFKDKQKGVCGLTMGVSEYGPLTDSAEDEIAAELKRQAEWGIHAHAIFSQEGGFPKELSKRVAGKSQQQGYNISRMPEYTEDEKAFVRGTYDFFGMNHYTSVLVSATKYKNKHPVPSVDDDIDVGTFVPPEWPGSALAWLIQVPNSTFNALASVKKTYNFDPIFYIFENGWSTNATAGLMDYDRVKYYRAALHSLSDAIHGGVKVKGYMAWSLMDNFEWFDGYAKRFGLYEVNFQDPKRTRTPRLSAFVYRDIIRKRYIDYSYNPNVIEVNEGTLVLATGWAAGISSSFSCFIISILFYIFVM